MKSHPKRCDFVFYTVIFPLFFGVFTVVSHKKMVEFYNVIAVLLYLLFQGGRMKMRPLLNGALMPAHIEPFSQTKGCNSSRLCVFAP